MEHRTQSSWVALLLAVTSTAGATSRLPSVGRVVVKNLMKVEGDRLHEFAPVLGDLTHFPGSGPSHDGEQAAFGKALATRLGVRAVKLEVVRNAMVGDEVDPPVSTLEIDLSDDQLADAVAQMKGTPHARSLQSQGGLFWELGRVVLAEGPKTLTWSFARPALPTVDWDAASLEVTRKAILAIVKDPTGATLTRFVEDIKKRAAPRGAAFWDDERTTYTFNISDWPKFVGLAFVKPAPGGPLLKELGFSQVTFEQPCDAEWLEVVSANGAPLGVGKWEIRVRTGPSADYQGAVTACTMHDKVKPISADKVQIESVDLSLAKP